MIHPDTELRFVSDEMGYGVFAKKRIPKGTIVYVKDQLEIELTRAQMEQLGEEMRAQAEKYCYRDQRGIYALSWDNAKYVNHRCDCNTMSSGYGFEIAICDIEVDEEITDEYGLFNIDVPIEIGCGCDDCRGVLLPGDIDTYAQVWDDRVRSALDIAGSVLQPLWGLLESEIQADVEDYIAGRGEYRSVQALKWLSTVTPSASTYQSA